MPSEIPAYDLSTKQTACSRVVKLSMAQPQAVVGFGFLTRGSELRARRHSLLPLVMIMVSELVRQG